MVAQVVEVAGQLPGQGVWLFGGRADDAAPAGHPRAHPLAQFGAGETGLQPGQGLEAEGAGPHQAHLAAPHIDQLRQGAETAGSGQANAGKRPAIAAAAGIAMQPRPQGERQRCQQGQQQATAEQIAEALEARRGAAAGMAEGLHPLGPGRGQQLGRQALQKGFCPTGQGEQAQALLLPGEQGGAIGGAGLVLQAEGHPIEGQPGGQGLGQGRHRLGGPPLDAAGDGARTHLDGLGKRSALLRSGDQQPLLLRAPEVGRALAQAQQQVGAQAQGQHRQQKGPAHRGLELLPAQQGAGSRQREHQGRRRQAVA